MSERASAPRVVAIDILRGFVMVLMSIDHASGEFNAGRLFTDAATMYKPGMPLPAAQFFTRWISHLCAPTFVLLAGTALAISTERRAARGESRAQIDRHIVVRGLLLILFEIAWMSWALLDPGRILLQVLYALGASLLCMTALRRLGDRLLFAIGLGLALGSELLVGAGKGMGIGVELVSGLLVTGGFFFGGKLIVGYPLLPWLSVMCLGWVLGRRLLAWRASGKDERSVAARVLLTAGVIALMLFVGLRANDGFGNMHLLRDGNDVVHWLHVSKYPPSVTYLGLELGLSVLLLAALMRLGSGATRRLEPLRLLGQTALFFYLLHVHAMWIAARLLGVSHKLGVLSSYGGALAVVIALYPACAWYRRYKAAHPNGWARWI